MRWLMLLMILLTLSGSTPVGPEGPDASGPPAQSWADPFGQWSYEGSAPETREEFAAVFAYAMATDVERIELRYDGSHDEEALRSLVRSSWTWFFESYPEYSMYRKCRAFTLDADARGISLVLKFEDMEGLGPEQLAQSLAMASEAYSGISSREGWKDLSETDRARAMAQWVCDNMEYGYAGSESASAYGGFRDHVGVCGAYTGMYDLLLRLDGIECHGRYGTGVANGEAHVWTVAELDGRLVNIDVTWSDGRVFRDKYFSKTDEEFARTHKWT